MTSSSLEITSSSVSSMPETTVGSSITGSREDVDPIYQKELTKERLELDNENFMSQYLESEKSLVSKASSFFKYLTKDRSYDTETKRWTGWPEDTTKANWPLSQRRMVFEPNKTLSGSENIRKLDIAYYNYSDRRDWCDLDVVGELKERSTFDRRSTQLQLATYCYDINGIQRHRMMPMVVFRFADSAIIGYDSTVTYNKTEECLIQITHKVASEAGPPSRRRRRSGVMASIFQHLPATTTFRVVGEKYVHPSILGKATIVSEVIRLEGVENVINLDCYGDVLQSGEPRYVRRDMRGSSKGGPEYVRRRLEADSLTQLLTAIIECVQAHQEAWTSNRILHRDLSLRNMLINVGLLIDFDVAFKVTPDSNIPLGVWTGTPAFMALALLRQRRNYTHSAADDLESVFWEGGEKVTNERSLEKYKTWQHIDLIAFRDKLDIISDKNAFNLVLEDSDLYRTFFFLYGSTDTMLRPLEEKLYDKVINCLRDASLRLP
ncbi:hypothetical protein V1514DRAFT_331656 [Lipomyces japonicus]|uniref:uncharacterized protein n=1 Tax=Lipomyces japonicus TaxID=56871 RepID=UPI0034CEE1C4